MQEQSTRSGLGRLAVSPQVKATFESYAVWLGGRKLRPRTIDTYLRDLRHFVVWLGEEPTIADVTAERVELYQAALRGRAASTISQHLSAVRSWCRWCQRARLRADDPTMELQWPQRGKRLPRALKTHELRLLEEILAAPAPVASRRKRLWDRNRRVVILLLYTGLRRSELAGLDWAEVDLEDRCAIIHEETAKGGDERVIVLHPRIVAELERTPLRERRGPVVCSLRQRQGQRNGISATTIGRIFEVWLVESGLDISAHRLRHSCATEMLRAGAGLRDVQQQLGHADIRTTEGYLDLLHEQQRQAVDRLPDAFG